MLGNVELDCGETSTLVARIGQSLPGVDRTRERVSICALFM